MNNLKTIEQNWQEFAALIFRKMKPAPTQYDEMKKAFFAGAYGLLVAMQEIGEPHISEDEGTAYLEAIEREGVAFGKRILAEYAETN